MEDVLLDNLETEKTKSDTERKEANNKIDYINMANSSKLSQQSDTEQPEKRYVVSIPIHRVNLKTDFLLSSMQKKYTLSKVFPLVGDYELATGAKITTNLKQMYAEVKPDIPIAVIDVNKIIGNDNSEDDPNLCECDANDEDSIIDADEESIDDANNDGDSEDSDFDNDRQDSSVIKSSDDDSKHRVIDYESDVSAPGSTDDSCADDGYGDSKSTIPASESHTNNSDKYMEHSNAEDSNDIDMAYEVDSDGNVDYHENNQHDDDSDNNGNGNCNDYDRTITHNNV